jgi:hypothetical protein
MSQAAHVESLQALEQFRAALVQFREEADQALTTIRCELDRFLEWLAHEQLAHWQQQIRQREDRLAEAKNDLHRCLAATIDPRRTPSCYQEEKVVEQAKRRLAEAEQKLAAVRRWIPIVRRAAFEYCARAEPLSSALASELPAAAGLLDRCIARLLAYQQLAAPQAEATTIDAATPVRVHPDATSGVSAQAAAPEERA